MLLKDEIFAPEQGQIRPGVVGVVMQAIEGMTLAEWTTG
jgi:hypothetical protein